MLFVVYWAPNLHARINILLNLTQNLAIQGLFKNVADSRLTTVGVLGVLQRQLATHTLVRSNRRLTIRELGEECGIRVGSCCEMLSAKLKISQHCCEIYATPDDRRPRSQSRPRLSGTAWSFRWKWKLLVKNYEYTKFHCNSLLLQAVHFTIRQTKKHTLLKTV